MCDFDPIGTTSNQPRKVPGSKQSVAPYIMGGDGDSDDG